MDGTKLYLLPIKILVITVYIIRYFTYFEEVDSAKVFSFESITFLMLSNDSFLFDRMRI